MSEQDVFYIHKLYPLQDQVLKLFTELESKFYLTGEAAISRFMLKHRYSDDLDFFLNNDNKFTAEAEKPLVGWRNYLSLKPQKVSGKVCIKKGSDQTIVSKIHFFEKKEDYCALLATVSKKP